MEPARELLLARLAASQAQIEALELDFARMVLTSEGSNADDEHDPEGPTIAFERQQLDAVLTRALATRAELQAALHDLDQGSYGRCERCGQPIGAARLEARPQARRCITCASLRA
jgi:RNA polymerase-binding transcription factor DksA